MDQSFQDLPEAPSSSLPTNRCLGWVWWDGFSDFLLAVQSTGDPVQLRAGRLDRLMRRDDCGLAPSVKTRNVWLDDVEHLHANVREIHDKAQSWGQSFMGWSYC
jgi:hypothetical protein